MHKTLPTGTPFGEPLPDPSEVQGQVAVAWGPLPQHRISLEAQAVAGAECCAVNIVQ